jgi:hypothetical protein
MGYRAVAMTLRDEKKGFMTLSAEKLDCVVA